MAAKQKAEKKTKPTQMDPSNLDLDPDAWPRFERAVDAAVKSGPIRQTKKKKAAKMGPKPHKPKPKPEKSK
ncbi:MAG: hypothetical protein IIA72_18690 [Proteobacteria bacterium]|nr:hypothetical protein [Pseudomonadota bacterium]